jgi:hypothetical protein
MNNNPCSDAGNSNPVLACGILKFRRNYTMITAEMKKEIIATYGRTPEDTVI